MTQEIPQRDAMLEERDYALLPADVELLLAVLVLSEEQEQK